MSVTPFSVNGFMDSILEALQQGIAPAIVVAIYLIITKWIETKKEANTIKLNTELTKSINSIASFLEDITKNIVDKDKEKCKVAINDALSSSAMRLTAFVATTIVNNHINNNKEGIISNIHNIVNAEYYSTYATLYLYKVDNIRCSEFLKKEWVKEIEEDVTNVIYNTSLSKEDRIVSFTNKITFKFKSYGTYISNNIIK